MIAGRGVLPTPGATGDGRGGGVVGGVSSE
jgi:hypothetical protein